MAFEKRIKDIKRAEEAEKKRKQKLEDEKQAEKQREKEERDRIVNLIQKIISSDLYPMLMKVGKRLLRNPKVGYSVNIGQEVYIALVVYDVEDYKTEGGHDGTGSGYVDYYYRGISLSVYTDRVEFSSSVFSFSDPDWLIELTELILDRFEQLAITHSIQSGSGTGKSYDDHEEGVTAGRTKKSLLSRFFSWLTS